MYKNWWSTETQFFPKQKLLETSRDAGSNQCKCQIYNVHMGIHTRSRVLISCCAVARVQHLGQNSRFCATAAAMFVARSVTRDFWRATFFAGKRKCYAPFLAGGGKYNWSTFFQIRRGRFFLRPLFVFAVVENSQLGNFVIRRRLFFFFFLIGAFFYSL